MRSCPSSAARSAGWSCTRRSRRYQTIAVEVIHFRTGYVDSRTTMSDVVRDFPLFPLGIVALPHELVPLHIFEERYRTMIGECLDRGSEFGIVWAADDGMRPVGCAMEIAEVLERMEDGRLNILTRGTRPFRIVDEQDDLPYPAGTVEFLEDKEEPADAGTARSAQEAYSELVEEATDRTIDPDELAAMSAYEMAASVDFGLEGKQG